VPGDTIRARYPICRGRSRLLSGIINYTNEAYVSIESLISRDLLRTTADATLSDVATTMISMASGSVLVFDAQGAGRGDHPAGHRPGGLAGGEHRASPGEKYMTTHPWVVSLD
jgi:hypothetical protein